MNRFVCLAALVGIAVSSAAAAQDAPKGNADNGRKVYLADGCFTCHGRSGQGGAYNGPAPILAKTMMPFDGFKGQIRSPARDMPAYSEAVLSDAQIADIYAFVQSLAGARPYKDIPLLTE
jgi:mono/diheme cytochrome c family protein